MKEGTGRRGNEKSELDKGVAKGPKVIFHFLIPPKDLELGPDPSFTNKDTEYMVTKMVRYKAPAFQNPNEGTKTSALVTHFT